MVIQVVRVSDDAQTRLPDGADPPPLRAEGVVRDEDHPALLDRRLDLLRDRLHDLPAEQGRVRSRPDLPGGPYLVVGLARSGVGAALALRDRGEEVIGVDAGSPEGLGGLTEAGVEVHLREEGTALLARAGAVIKSPGVPREAPVIAGALARRIEVLGELEMAWRLLENEVIAVTGTNGKTTTVEWIGHIHRTAGLPVTVAGNVGTALSGLAGKTGQDVTVVCEASSFQLQDTNAFAAEAAVLLNITPDHLDRHGTFDRYLAGEARDLRAAGQRGHRGGASGARG